jgi:hypothetical protein
VSQSFAAHLLEDGDEIRTVHERVQGGPEGIGCYTETGYRVEGGPKADPVQEGCWLSCTRKEATFFASSVPAKRPSPRDDSMAKLKSDPGNGLRKEYDFAGGVRGKYVERYAQGSGFT